jgi:hypothetical protein
LNYGDRDAVSEAGMAAVKLAVLTHLKWIFRDQPIQDRGIDAQVEQTVNGEATGRLIALQIKSGVSWFKERTRSGIVYRGELKHWTYWQGHSLPVLIVLYDPIGREAYWQAISEKTVDVTGVGWKVTVPLRHKINSDAIRPWSELCLPEAAQRFARRQRVFAKISNDIQGHPESRWTLLYQALHLSRKVVCLYAPFISEHLIAVLDFVSIDCPVRAIIGPNQTESTIDFLRRRHSDVLQVKIAPSLHRKALIIDSAIVVFGSGNFTDTGFANTNTESFEASTAEYRVRAALGEFFANWEHSLLLSVEELR